MMRELRAGDLRSGDKIDQIQVGSAATGIDSLLKIKPVQVDWMSGRRRDAPLPDDGPVVTRSRPRDESSNGERPMISGQLMIFELDEEPPEFEGRTKAKIGGFLEELQSRNYLITTSSSGYDSSPSACAISRSGLFAVAGGLGAVCAALFIAVLTMFFKLSRIDGTSHSL